MKELISMKVVECSGTYYEVGRQYGEASQENLQKTLGMCLGTLTGFMKATRNESVSKEDVLSVADKFLPMTERFDPRLIEFVKGVADGSAMSFREAFYLRCAYDILLNYGQISCMCTSFALTGKATTGGKTIIGRNIDFNGDWPFELLKIRYDDGLDQLALCVGGVEWEVMNSNGFCNSMNGIFNTDYRCNLPYGCYMFKVMRQRSIGASLRVLCQSARGLLYHVLADADGSIIGLESTSEEYQIIDSENDILTHANHYLTERYRAVDGAYTTLRDFPDTFLRAKRIRRLLEQQYGDITPEVVMEILADHLNYPNSICRHPEPGGPPGLLGETLASVIMVPEERKMLIAYGNPCTCRFVEYRI